MKKFVIKCLVLFIAFAASDFAIGKVCNYMIHHAYGGHFGRTSHAIYRSTEDVMIFGSSRASHHYVPKVISDSLGLSCYNNGLDGNGVFFYYPTIKAMLERYTPKLVVIDVTPNFDLLEFESNNRYIDAMKLFFNQGYAFDSLAIAIEPAIAIKRYSNIYLTNSKYRVLVTSMLKNESAGICGYVPLYGEYKETQDVHITNYNYDPMKLTALEQAIALVSSKTNLLICVSPNIISALPLEVFAPVESLCERYNVPFVLHWTDSEFCKASLFKDAGHLNDEGAYAYTAYLAHEIRRLVTTL